VFVFECSIHLCRTNACATDTIKSNLLTYLLMSRYKQWLIFPQSGIKIGLKLSLLGFRLRNYVKAVYLNQIYTLNKTSSLIFHWAQVAPARQVVEGEKPLNTGVQTERP